MTTDHTSNTIPARGSEGRANSLRVAITGCLNDWRKERREVSLINDGFPSLASMNLAATPVPILAVYTPNAISVRPAAYCDG